jgi:Domain of unknown function (DUF4282)
MSDYGTPPPSEPFGQPTPPTAASGKGFFGALFDFKFEHFITPMIVKLVYVLALVALVIGWLAWLVIGFAQDATYGVAVLILGPILLVLYLAFIRMTLEFYLAIVRMSQDIHTRLR